MSWYEENGVYGDARNHVTPPRRRTTRKRADGRPRTGYVTGFVIGMLVTLLAIAITAMAFRWKAEQESKERPVSVGPTHDSMTITYDYRGEATRYYVMTDPDYGVQYVVNDKGGMCPRLDASGNNIARSYPVTSDGSSE